MHLVHVVPVGRAEAPTVLLRSRACSVQTGVQAHHVGKRILPYKRLLPLNKRSRFMQDTADAELLALQRIDDTAVQLQHEVRTGHRDNLHQASAHGPLLFRRASI